MPPKFDPAAALARRTFDWMREYPHRPMFGLAAILMGTAVAAFAMSPDSATPLNQQLAPLVEEPYALPIGTIEAQLQAMQRDPLHMLRSTLSRRTDTPESILKRLGISDTPAANFLRSNPLVLTLLDGRSDRKVNADIVNGRLMSMTILGPSAQEGQLLTHYSRLSIARNPDASAGLSRFNVVLQDLPFQTESEVSAATLSGSFFDAADEAGVPDTVTNQLADLFSNDIDFRHDLHDGDHFTVVYQTLWAEGEIAPWLPKSSRVLAARFTNHGQTYDAIWFQPPGQAGGYFNLNGSNKTRQFLGAPLEYSRITSGFRLRFHPFLKQWRQHLGIDYGAPLGTAVRTIGDGTVVFSGRQGGYGNVVIIKHNGDRETRYAHLSRMMVREGASVSQGQIIGSVGSTGWATGPHLHFEFLVNGHHIDPLTVARNADAARISEENTALFKTTAAIAQTQLKAAAPSATSVVTVQKFD